MGWIKSIFSRKTSGEKELEKQQKEKEEHDSKWPPIPETLEEFIVHDYRTEVRGWGWNYEYRALPSPIEDSMDGLLGVSTRGQYASMIGWGNGLKDGHFIVMDHTHTVLYQLTNVRYDRSVRDMWSADARWIKPDLIPSIDEHEEGIEVDEARWDMRYRGRKKGEPRLLF